MRPHPFSTVLLFPTVTEPNICCTEILAIGYSLFSRESVENSFSQTSELVKRFHKCVVEEREYLEKDWDSLMELPPHSSRRRSLGHDSQESPSMTQYDSFVLGAVTGTT